MATNILYLDLNHSRTGSHSLFCKSANSGGSVVLYLVKNVFLYNGLETLTMSDTSNCSKCAVHHKLSQKEEEINVSYNHHIVQKESAYL